MSGVQANLLLQGVANSSPWLSTDELLAPQRQNMLQQRNALLNRVDEQNLQAQDMEMIARASAYLETLPDTAARQAAYPGVVSQLQQSGFAKNAPSVYPGDERISQLARMGTPSKELLTLSENRRTGQALLGGGGGTTPAAPATTGGGGGAAPSSLAIPGRGTGGPGASAQMPPELLQHFREASAETGIPMALLIAQARQESGFRMDRPGAAGEIGIMQIKPSTARDPGGMQGVDPATLSDARQNILFGARYLKSRMRGDPNDPAVQAAALAAYNGGGDPKYVQNVFRYLPTLAPSDPAVAVTTYTPGGAPTGGVAARTGGTDVAGPPGTVPARPTGGSGGVVATDGTTTAQGAVPAQQPPAATTAAVPGLLQLDQRGLTANDRSELGALVQSGRLAPTDLAAAIQQRATANNAHNNQAITQARAARTEERQLRTEERTVEQQQQAAADRAAAAQRDEKRLELQINEAKRAGLPTGYRLDDNGKAVRIDGLPPDPAVLEAQAKAGQLAKQQFDQENTLRDEFQKLTGDFRIVQTSYENIRSAAKANDGAGDMSLLYNYVRLLDPTSVVRESEFAAAAASGSFGERVQGAVQRVLSGARMPESLRESFIREGRNLYDNQLRSHNDIADKYETLARRNGLEPDRVVTRFNRPQPEPTPPVPPPEQRKAGGVYQTPKGPMKWTGTGWLPMEE